MPKSLEQQMKEVFGPGFTMAVEQPGPEAFNESMKRDLSSSVGFNEKPFSDALTLVLSDLTHSQAMLAISDYLAKQSVACPVANVIITRTLETNLGASLARTANSAGGPVEPLFFSSVERIAGIIEMSELVNG